MKFFGTRSDSGFVAFFGVGPIPIYNLCSGQMFWENKLFGYYRFIPWQSFSFMILAQNMAWESVVVFEKMFFF